MSNRSCKLAIATVLLIGNFVSSVALAEKKVDKESNFNYEKLIEGNHKFHLISFSPDKWDLKIAKAHETALGKQKITEIAKRYQVKKAAINAGFFSSFGKEDGLPQAILRQDGYYSISTTPSAALGWKAGKFLMDHISNKVSFVFDDNKYETTYLNRLDFPENETVIFTSSFGKKTLTSWNRVEVIVSGGIVSDVKYEGNSEIPADGFVISFPMINTYLQMPAKLVTGKPASYEVKFESLTGYTKPEDWQAMPNIVNGRPLLLKYGKVMSDNWSVVIRNPNLITDAYARTALCTTQDGLIKIIVAEHDKTVTGPSLVELAKFMQGQGCVDAINLDGAEKSSLLISENETKDKVIWPSQLRPISDAIVIIPKITS